MSLFQPNCPSCGAALIAVDVPKSESFTWQCPAGHGDAIPLSVGFEVLQQDEIDDLFRRAAGMPATGKPSPIDGQPMVQVTIAADADETFGNTGKDAIMLTLDVDVSHQFVWFDAGELAAMPKTGGGNPLVKLWHRVRP